MGYFWFLNIMETTFTESQEVKELAEKLQEILKKYSLKI